ncbi:PP2C family protein-serine/threonine phosphatase [Schlesneria paludicola]|uniref:PP2C family protein-serine/threonine phosphatase n=1 Tax=Schlesneria paludicola TaxID=360056 RepID=UPI00029A6DB2|nr:protein phosphatase 2C domain-containing protein [Schlesneria paludicola]
MDNVSLTDTEVFPASTSNQKATSTISSLVEVDLGGLSDPGKTRPNNEDTFFVARFDRAMQTLMTNLPLGEYPDTSHETGYGMVVADGMGGHAAGEVASRTAVRVLLDLVLQTPDWIMRLDDQWADQIFRRTEQRVQAIQEVLTNDAKEHASLTGMGTTLTLACSVGAELLVAHVGDSRAYLMREGQLRRLTHDQTVAQAMVDAGIISVEDAAQHRMRHALTGVLSTGKGKVPVEFGRFQLADGDQVLLCTDGLTEMISEAALAEVLRQPGTSDKICRTLVNAALQAGGKDNVTVILARYRFPANSTPM